MSITSLVLVAYRWESIFGRVIANSEIYSAAYLVSVVLVATTAFARKSDSTVAHQLTTSIVLPWLCSTFAFVVATLVSGYPKSFDLSDLGALAVIAPTLPFLASGVWVVCVASICAVLVARSLNLQNN